MRIKTETLQTDATLLANDSQHCWRWFQSVCTLYVAKSLTGFKQHGTASNNMQQGVQTDATCNMQQSWELLANDVASVCTVL